MHVREYRARRRRAIGWLATVAEIDVRMRPWLERIIQDTGPLDLFDAHTHIGGNDPDGYRQTPDELLEALDHVGARAVVFAMHEPDGYRAANDAVLAAAAAQPEPARRVLPRQPARRRARRGAPRARRGRARDQAAPARRAVRDGRAGRRRAGRARARAPRAGADPCRPRHTGAGGEHRPARRASPGRDADPRPRGDLRPRMAVARAAVAPERADRQLVVEPGRPRRAVRARAARERRLRERLALRAPAAVGGVGAALRAAGRLHAGAAARHRRGHDRARARRRRAGRARAAAGPAARRRSTCCSSARSRTCARRSRGSPPAPTRPSRSGSPGSRARSAPTARARTCTPRCSSSSTATRPSVEPPPPGLRFPVAVRATWCTRCASRARPTCRCRALPDAPPPTRAEAEA